MSKEQENNQSEEVDLGQLFKVIGNGFRSFFNGIASIFKGIFEGIIFVLAHFYKRWYWYTGVIIVGFIIGFVLNSTSEKSYGANMYIKTNFNSGRQVYENMKQLHQLANVDQDTIELGRLLDISPSEASKIKGFYIMSNTDRNTVSEMYSEYRQNLDSVSQSELTFEIYKESLADYELPVHQIGVAATDKFIYRKIEDGFKDALVDNNYLKELSEVNSENLKREKEALENQVDKTDFLIDEFLKIKIAQSQKPESSGTSIYMGDTESGETGVNEAELLKEKLKLEEQKRETLQKMVEEKDIISVVSGFPSSGYDTSTWKDKKYYTLPLVLFSLTLLIFILTGIHTFLKKREENHKV
jgi:hypothetical protein